VVAKGAVVLLDDDLAGDALSGMTVQFISCRTLAAPSPRPRCCNRSARLKAAPAQASRSELGDHVLDVPLGLPVPAHDATHLVMRHAPDILGEEEAFEAPLISLVELQPVVVEDADVGGARVYGEV